MDVNGALSAAESALTDAVVIDGRSGSGKTSLSARIAESFGAAGRTARILHVEDLYPGWDGLAAGSRAVPTVLGAGGFRRYDWESEEFAEWVPLPPGVPLVVEGCGALTAPNLAAVGAWVSDAANAAGSSERSVRAIWLEGPAELRRSRALARDGDVFAPHWERWAAQEDAFYDEHRPWALADEILRVDG